MPRRNPAIELTTDEDSSDVNLTPMLDVVFILLIFFVVTAAFIREYGVPVNKPGFPDYRITEVESVVVTVEPAGNFVVNGRRVGADSLLPYVRALAGNNPDVAYSVQMAPGSRTGDIVTAVDVGRSIGIDVVPLANKN
ncbi:MAG: biopolymer transporter ExbD [Pseudomonadota bacterium]